MSSPAFTYRQLDENHDVIWGQGSADYLSNRDAVAQAVQTRLLLFEGEWWADKTDGLPLWQSILGQGGSSQDNISLLIQQRILGTPYVTGISQLAFVYNARSRSYSFSAIVVSQFGNIPVTTNTPVPPVQTLPGA